MNTYRIPGVRVPEQVARELSTLDRASSSRKLQKALDDNHYNRSLDRLLCPVADEKDSKSLRILDF